MKYAHLADSHLGAWRDQKMRDLSTEAFLAAVDECLRQEVDFILFAGDLFNTSLPALDILKTVTAKLKELKDKNVPFYAIAGSHDFSPSGKTMIDVLEKAGLLINVCKGTVNEETQQLHLNFTVDKKTGAKLTGLLGRKGQLDKAYYENLNLETLEQEPGYKIFLFHTTLTELKPPHLEKVESHPVSFLPRGFNYYAGGHLHHPAKIELENYGLLTYPGALFPNNFAEVEKYGQGGYYLITAEDNPNNCKENSQKNNRENSQESNWMDSQASNQRSNQPGNQQTIGWQPVKMSERHSLLLDCGGKTPESITAEIIKHFDSLNSENSLKNSLITIRLTGTLEQGRISHLNFKEIFRELYAQGAYFVMKNTAQVNSPEFEEIKLSASRPETIEEELIQEHLQQNKLFEPERERHLTKALLTTLNTLKKEGETVTDFQRRVESEMNQLLEI